MIVKLTWHGEPIGKLDAQFVWPPPLDRGALLPLLSVSRGGAAISVVFQFSGPLAALELDLAKPVVLLGPLGGPSEVGEFQGHVAARFDEVDVHGFVDAPLGSPGARGPRVVIQREAGEFGFAVGGSGLAGQLELAAQGGPLSFGAAVAGSRSRVRAYPQGGGVIEMRAEHSSDLIASLNWRWPRPFDEESPWAVALRALLGFITEHQSAALWLGFELEPQPASAPVSSFAPPEIRGPSVAPPRSDRATAHAQAAAAGRSGKASSVMFLGGVAVALVAVIAAVLLWRPPALGNGPSLLPSGTVSTGALQPKRPGSTAAGDAR